jgi:hypothetical protein
MPFVLAHTHARYPTPVVSSQAAPVLDRWCSSTSRFLEADLRNRWRRKGRGERLRDLCCSRWRAARRSSPPAHATDVEPSAKYSIHAARPAHCQFVHTSGSPGCVFRKNRRVAAIGDVTLHRCIMEGTIGTQPKPPGALGCTDDHCARQEGVDPYARGGCGDRDADARDGSGTHHMAARLSGYVFRSAETRFRADAHLAARRRGSAPTRHRRTPTAVEPDTTEPSGTIDSESDLSR